MKTKEQNEPEEPILSREDILFGDPAQLRKAMIESLGDEQFTALGDIARAAATQPKTNEAGPRSPKTPPL